MQPDFPTPKPADTARCRQLGVSLIEALVALAVMAFGILGVIGVQTTLRVNGDIAKQRAEAVRIASEAIEDWRAFTVLTSTLPTGHTTSFAQMVTDTSPTTVTGTASNTTFSLTRTVATSTDPLSKTLQVDVSWADRSGATQNVVLTTRVAGVLPELSGSLSIPSKSLLNRQVKNRNTVIPVSAVDQQNGTSNFTPPSPSPGPTWVFNNTTGLILNVTAACSAAPSTCSASAALLAGYVRFALTSFNPTDVESENPPAPPSPPSPFAFEVQVVTTAPAAATINCFEQSTAAFVAYYCAVPLPTTPPQVWSGRSLIDTTTLSISSNSGVSATDYRVCRYTDDATTDTPAGGNIAHPLNYSAVGKSLVNQNFLVIPAGNGSTAFVCPTDDASTVFIDGDTRAHQPPN